MQHRHEHVYVETARHRITGVLTLPADGYRSRLSDLLNAPERDFIALSAAIVQELDGDRTIQQHEFIAVHRQHVVFAVSLGPVDDPAAN